MTGIIIQARMRSTRLPGKVMKKLAGKEILWHVVKRCAQSKLAQKVIVATSQDAGDDIIYRYCRKNGIEVWRGNLLNVLARYYECARRYKLDSIVRVTSDCPLIDPFIIDECIRIFQAHRVDYVSNCLKRVFPRGLDCEVFSFAALKNAAHRATLQKEQEHVTPYIIKHASTLAYQVEPQYQGNFRLTLDEKEDYTLLHTIYKTFYQEGAIIDVTRVIQFLKDNPAIAQINTRVQQKE